MTKSGLVVALCFFWVSGCALFSGSEVTSEESAQTTPVVENQSVPATTSAQTFAPETRVTSARNFTREEVRAMQLRLRDVGLDPGPVDGLAGAKTKAAFARFQSGCSKITPLMNSFEGTAQPTESTRAASQVPSRQEIQTIQTHLRDAGFNPGPIDGVFGSRTKSVLAHVKAGCPMVNDFAGMLKQQDLASQRSENATKQAAPATPARSQEDVRILQLRLRDAGFDPGPFDGVMGPKTRAAWAQYQVMQRENNAKVPVITGIRHY